MKKRFTETQIIGIFKEVKAGLMIRRRKRERIAGIERLVIAHAMAPNQS